MSHIRKGRTARIRRQEGASLRQLVANSMNATERLKVLKGRGITSGNEFDRLVSRKAA